MYIYGIYISIFHVMEYYSAFKRMEILSYVIKWINLEDIMLNAISQSPKDKYYMVSFI